MEYLHNSTSKQLFICWWNSLQDFTGKKLGFSSELDKQKQLNIRVWGFFRDSTEKQLDTNLHGFVRKQPIILSVYGISFRIDDVTWKKNKIQESSSSPMWPLLRSVRQRKERQQEKEKSNNGRMSVWHSFTHSSKVDWALSLHIYIYNRFYIYLCVHTHMYTYMYVCMYIYRHIWAIFF